MNLDKEFIPYEQALALKELGFDEPCLAFFTWKNELKPIKQLEDVFNSLKNSKVNTTYCSSVAPTFSQAFRWFREKYKLYHNIKMFGDWDKPQYSYIISGRTMINPAHMWYYKDVNSYPEAELACLKKLIEIIKTK